MLSSKVVMSRESTLLLLLLPLAACGSGVGGSGEGEADAKPNVVPIAEDASPGCTAEVADTYYADTDGDGYGSADLTAVDCVQPSGFVANSDDCNDADSSINPDGLELCDGLDNDCNSATAETCPSLCSVQTNGADIYLFCDQAATQANASLTCIGQGMHLVRIDSMDEQAYLSEQRIVAFGGRKKTYIGATDLTTENTWLWEDGSQFWQGRSGGAAVDGLFSYWRGSEPNDDGTEDCAGMRDNSSSTGRWVDFECGQSQRFICERDPTAL
jgi:hypothetical protein